MEQLPDVLRIIQRLDDTRIDDIDAQVTGECEKFADRFPGGEKIAVAVGSRGITNLQSIVKSVVNFLKNKGNEVIIVPAMGSHGGATAEGQIEVLEGYGITEEAVGAPICSSMEVVELESSDLENRVFVDKNAYECDGTVVLNRIKAHTDYTGEVESGLLKMCCIGLGKQRQAVEIHRRGTYGLSKLIRPTAERIMEGARIRVGLAIIENPYHHTKSIEALDPADVYEREKVLLQEANRNIAQLPIEDIDILCVDEMGKNISGVGIDPNVIGYTGIRYQEGKNKVQITTIIADDLTNESHGNAIGVGLADIISRKLYDKIDFHATYENTITSSFLERAKVPIVKENYEKALETAMAVGGKGPDEVRLLRIKNTQELAQLYVSRAVYEEIKGSSAIEAVGDFVSWEKAKVL
jgi:hypothetical protein